jgi:rhodanese-related sulfurtransferase
MNIKTGILILLLLIVAVFSAFSLGKNENKAVDFEGPGYWELSSDEAADLIKNINPFILDVRTKGEYLKGHLEGAYLLPVQILEREIELIEKYKDQDILIYCRSGNRSTVASKILLDSGFTNVYNLRYGINEWIAKGYPVVVE